MLIVDPSRSCMRLPMLRKGWVLTKGVNLFHDIIHLPLNTNLHRVRYQPWRVLSQSSAENMKRKATDAGSESKPKRQREPQADYCDVEPRKNSQGNTVWPASEQSINCARDFLKEW